MEILHDVDAETGKSITVSLLHEFGNGDITPEKTRDLWLSFSKHTVLFSDETKGKFEVFFDHLINPRSVWLEVIDDESQVTIGVMTLTDVIPGFDADAHFAIWNGHASPKINVFLGAMNWAFSRYHLHRMTCEIPTTHHGVIRFVKRLGFQDEGIRREATIRDGKWLDSERFGITIGEMEEKNGIS